jgi:acetyl-CoA C-acetyltransferase
MRIPIAGVSALPPQAEIPSSLEEMIYTTTAGALLSAGISIDDIDGVCMASSDLNDGRAISTMTLTGSTGSFRKTELRVCNDSLAAFWVAAAEIGSEAATRLIVSSWNKASDVVDPYAIPALALEPAMQRPLGYHPDVVYALRRSHDTGEVSVLSHELPTTADVAVGFVLGSVPAGHRLADLVGTGSSMAHYVDIGSRMLASTEEAARAALKSAGIAWEAVRKVFVAGMHAVPTEEIAQALDIPTPRPGRSRPRVRRRRPRGDVGTGRGLHRSRTRPVGLWCRPRKRSRSRSGEMMKNNAAVIGFGQTKYKTSRSDVSAPELVFEAVSAALGDADLTMGEVDAVVFASAPEVFEGVYEPDRWCVEAFGGVGKPLVRVHTGGATGGSAGITGAHLVGSGMYGTVLVVGLQRTSETADAQAVFTTIFDPVFERDIQLNVITGIALVASRQMEFFGLTEDHLAWVSKKNFDNALLNPKAHLHKQITIDEVKQSRQLAWPLRLLHTCPRSDGAAAVVITSEAKAKRHKAAAWVRGAGCAADVYRIGDRIHDEESDFGIPRALKWACDKAYTQAGITVPIDDLDVIEVYAPFSNLEIAYYESMGLAPTGEGVRLVEDEATAIGGKIPVVPSGGCMTANPIGATGLVRFGEAALQVMGRAGDHQVEDAHVAMATACGGIDQFYTAAILASTPG